MTSQESIRKSFISLFSMESASPRKSESNEAVIKGIFANLERMMGGNRSDLGTLSPNSERLSPRSLKSPRTLQLQNVVRGASPKLPFQRRVDTATNQLKVNSNSSAYKISGPVAGCPSVGSKIEEYKLFSDQSDADLNAGVENELPISPSQNVIRILQQFVLGSDTPVHPFLEDVRRTDAASLPYSVDGKSLRRSILSAQQQYHQNQTTLKARQDAELMERIQRLESKVDAVENTSGVRNIVSRMTSSVDDQDSRLARMERRLDENVDQFSETENVMARQELEFDKVKCAMHKTDVMRQATEKVLMTAIESLHTSVNELKTSGSRDTLPKIGSTFQSPSPNTDVDPDIRQELAHLQEAVRQIKAKCDSYAAPVNASGGESPNLPAKGALSLPTLDDYDMDQFNAKLQMLDSKQKSQTQKIEQLHEKNVVLSGQLEEVQSRMNPESPGTGDLPIEQSVSNSSPEVLLKISELEQQIVQMPTLFSNELSEIKLRHQAISQSVVDMTTTIETKNAGVIKYVRDVAEDLERVKQKEVEHQKRASEVEQLKRRLKDVEGIVEDSNMAMQKTRTKIDGSLNQVQSSVGDAADFSHGLALRLSTNEQALTNLQSKVDSLAESVAPANVTVSEASGKVTHVTTFAKEVEIDFSGSPKSPANPDLLRPDVGLITEKEEKNVKRSSTNIIDNRSFEAQFHPRRAHRSNSQMSGDDVSIRSAPATTAFEKRMLVLEERHARLRQALKREDET